MPAAYMLATVAVCPSTDPEGFGRVPVEAQAMGRPVIASDHGGARETIVRGETECGGGVTHRQVDHFPFRRLRLCEGGLRLLCSRRLDTLRDRFRIRPLLWL
jgi:glycosyltransferase involved in cell wall biosynthesis